MDTSSVIELAREAMWVTLLVSAPLLAVVLIIGVVIGMADVAAIGRHPARELADQTGTIGADQLQDRGWRTHDTSSPWPLWRQQSQGP